MQVCNVSTAPTQVSVTYPPSYRVALVLLNALHDIQRACASLSLILANC